MPHNKKTVKRINPKKKGQKDRRPEAQPSKSNDSSFFASFQGLDSGGERTTPSFLDTPKESVYVLYKKSTRRIKDVLQSMVPVEIFETNSVNAFVDAADYIVENDMLVDSDLLSDLKFSIRVRKRIAVDKYGGGDEGHSHFIAVLVYCWSMLAPRRKQKLQQTEETDVTALSNRFEGLSAVEEESDEEADEDDLPRTPQPRPTDASQLTLDQLISGSSRINVILFLMTLEDLMEFTAKQFAKLKEASIASRQQGDPPSVVVADIMGASIAANFAIQQVVALEEAFVCDNPHLNTPYRSLAILAFAEYIQDVILFVNQNSPIALQFSERHAVEFVADAIEGAFRHVSSDPLNKSASLVPKFLRRWQIPRHSSGVAVDGSEIDIKEVFDAIQALVIFEAPIVGDHMFEHHLEEFADVKSHSWLATPYIGSDRSIVHTLRLVQQLSYKVKADDGMLSVPSEWFGTGEGWSDRKEPVTKISEEMDGLLVDDIMPILILLCNEGLISLDVPFQDELMSGFVQIRQFAKNPDRPVPWSLAFTVHTILTAIFEIEGSDHFVFLADTSQQTFQRFFAQIEASEVVRHATILQCASEDWEFVRTVHRLKLLLHAFKDKKYSKPLRPSIWGPFSAGCFLSYLAYFANLDWGPALLDSDHQLRVTLHMFNALKQVQALKPGDVELLDRIFRMFEGCEQMWNGKLPVRGTLKTRFLVSLGARAEFARRPRRPKEGGAYPYRERTGIIIANLSKSYRKVCLRDDSPATDTSKPGRRQRKDHDPVRKLMSHARHTLTAMSHDNDLLATNMISLGTYLNQFFIQVAVEWGWFDKVEDMLPRLRAEDDEGLSDEAMKYMSFRHWFSIFILGPLDNGDELVASRCVELMTKFFNELSVDKVQWFAPKPMSAQITL